jgi:hypothetical protein
LPREIISTLPFLALAESAPNPAPGVPVRLTASAAAIGAAAACGLVMPPTNWSAVSEMFLARISPARSPWMIEAPLAGVVPALMVTVPATALRLLVSTTSPPVEVTLIAPVLEPMKLTPIG